MSRRKHDPFYRMPPAPRDAGEDVTQYAQERWQHCPLRDCKQQPPLLYEDYPLRDLRTDRLLCSACTVRQGMGYVGREAVQTDAGTSLMGIVADYVVTCTSALCLSVLLHSILLWVGAGIWLLAIAAGMASGLLIGAASTRLAGAQAGGTAGFAAVGGILLGTLGAPSVYILLVEQRLVWYWHGILNFEALACTAVMTITACAVFYRRTLPGDN